MINKIKGTQDFLDLTLFNFFINNAKKHLDLYRFTEINTPIIEPIELFKRSLGNFTDVVSKEMYTVNSNSSEEVICLRPEATASVMRAFLESGNILTPWKAYTWGPMFRYERPQKGRYRQFNQLSAEIIGTDSIDQDVFMIKMLDRFFSEKLKLDNYSLNINFLGCTEDRKKYKDLLYNMLPNTICSTCIERKEKNIMRVFDCKNEACKIEYVSMPKIADSLCELCSSEWKDLKNNLESLSVSFVYNPMLVRGLDYYEKTVFEFSSLNLGAQNAFCGGGRYKLAQLLGSKEDYPSIGFGIGIERVMLLLEQIKETLPIEKPKDLHLILPIDKEQELLALLLADEIQANNLKTDILFDSNSIKSKMRKADKLNARFVIIIGSEEQESKIFTVKDMLLNTESKISQNDIISFFKNQQQI